MCGKIWQRGMGNRNIKGINNLNYWCFPLIIYLKFLRRKKRCTRRRYFRWHHPHIEAISTLPFLSIKLKTACTEFSCDTWANVTLPNPYLKFWCIVLSLSRAAQGSKTINHNRNFSWQRRASWYLADHCSENLKQTHPGINSVAMSWNNFTYEDFFDGVRESSSCLNVYYTI